MNNRALNLEYITHYLRLLLSILLPPLGVALRLGVGLQFWMNIVLTVLGYIPGVLHVLWITVRL